MSQPLPALRDAKPVSISCTKFMAACQHQQSRPWQDEARAGEGKRAAANMKRDRTVEKIIALWDMLG
jgi:hypothetical protein